MRHPNLKRTAFGSVVAFVGYLLSPLSMWNDMFINLPLAFGFAYLTGWAISLVSKVNMMLFLALMSIGYLITNMLGFILMHHGVEHMKANADHKFSWQKSMFLSFGAFWIVAFLVQVGLIDMSQTQQMMASVLKVSYLQ